MADELGRSAHAAAQPNMPVESDLYQEDMPREQWKAWIDGLTYREFMDASSDPVSFLGLRSPLRPRTPDGPSGEVLASMCDSDRPQC